MTAQEAPALARRRTRRVLLLGNVLQAAGLQLFVPILPIYLRQQGSSNRLIGLTIACGIAGYGLAQFPSGVLADRFDRRLVLLWGMGVYAALFLIYLAPMPIALLPLVRLVHAGVGGIYSVASIAILGEATPDSERGHVFGQWQATTRSGFLIGPLVGGAVASIDVSLAFVGAALTYGVATAVMLRIPSAPGPFAPALTDGPTVGRLPSGRLLVAVLPLVVVAAAGDYGAGAFTAIWSLWLTAHGASPWHVGIAFCLFALPAVALSAVLGRATDRRGAQGLAVTSLVGLVLVAPLCALDVSVWTLTAFGVLVGLFCTPNRPIAFAAASRRYGGPSAARAQGSLQGGLMGVQLAAAACSGALLSLSPVLAFGMVSVVAIGSIVFLVLRPLSPTAVGLLDPDGPDEMRVPATG